MNRLPQPRPVALSVAQASAFLTRHDRHHAPPDGAVFALGLTRGGTLIAAAILGRPVPPAPDEPDTIEITRSGCRHDSDNTLGLLYEHAWRRARLRGYQRLITHTPVHACRITYGLRYVGLAPAMRLPPRAHTHTPWRASTDRGVDGVCRTRWDPTRHHRQPRTTRTRATSQRHRSPATGTPTSEPPETPAA